MNIINTLEKKYFTTTVTVLTVFMICRFACVSYVVVGSRAAVTVGAGFAIECSAFIS
jgi:hypothetical protein